MDIETSYNGDIILDSAQANRVNIVDFINQRVKHILRSKPGDWKFNLNVGANVAQYVGYPVVPSTKRLVEANIASEMKRDQILKVFPTQVIFTPASNDSAIIEIIVSLPDGTQIRINELLQTTGSMIGMTEPQFREAVYDTNNAITKSEIVELTQRSNIFELKYLPLDSSVFVVPIGDLEPLDENGTINPPVLTSGQTFPINFTLPWDVAIQSIYPFIVSGGVEVIVDNNALTTTQFSHTSTQIIIDGFAIENVIINVTYDVSGVATIQQDEEIDTRQTTFLFNAGIADIMKNKLVQALVVNADGENVPGEDFVANDAFLTTRIAYSDEVIFTVTYTDNYAIASVNELSLDSKPLNLFPRMRLSKRYMVTTRVLFEPGTYFIQYTTNPLIGDINA